MSHTGKSDRVEDLINDLIAREKSLEQGTSSLTTEAAQRPEGDFSLGVFCLREQFMKTLYAVEALDVLIIVFRVKTQSWMGEEKRCRFSPSSAFLFL